MSRRPSITEMNRAAEGEKQQEKNTNAMCDT